MNDKVRKFIVRQLEKLDPGLIYKTNLSTMLLLSEYLELLAACCTIETEAMVELPMLLCHCHMIYQAVKLMKVKWICPDHLRKTFIERLGGKLCWIRRPNQRLKSWAGLWWRR